MKTVSLPPVSIPFYDVCCAWEDFNDVYTYLYIFAVFFVRGSLFSLQNHHPRNDPPSPFLCASYVEEQRAKLQFCCSTAPPLCGVDRALNGFRRLRCRGFEATRAAESC